ncbi:MAG: hypothetical protein M3375_03670 [Actinomycetota bacterium]|nr:hypothetical protein [Actinomycetota bacterium]
MVILEAEPEEIRRLPGMPLAELENLVVLAAEAWEVPLVVDDRQALHVRASTRTARGIGAQVNILASVQRATP